MSADDTSALLQLEQDLFHAIRTRNREALGQLLAETFELHSPGNPVVKKADFLSAIASIPGEILAVESNDTQSRILGNVGVLIGRQHATVRLEDGTEATDVQAFTDVAVKEGGRWRLALAHSVSVTA